MDVKHRTRLLKCLGSLGITLALTLVACGATPGSAGTGYAPAAQGGATPASTAGAKVSPPPTSSAAALVVLASGAAHYAASDTITITVQNATSRTIYALTQFTDCSIISLQLRAGGGWQPVHLCAGGFPHPSIKSIAPGGTVAIQVATASDSNDSGGDAAAQWSAGTYRAELTYTISTSEPLSQGTPAYSTTFTIA